MFLGFVCVFVLVVVYSLFGSDVVINWYKHISAFNHFTIKYCIYVCVYVSVCVNENSFCGRCILCTWKAIVFQLGFIFPLISTIPRISSLKCIYTVFCCCCYPSCQLNDEHSVAVLSDKLFSVGCRSCRGVIVTITFFSLKKNNKIQTKKKKQFS